MFEMGWVDLACYIVTFLQPRIVMQEKLEGLVLPSHYIPLHFNGFIPKPHSQVIVLLFLIDGSIFVKLQCLRW
jgi:hypothetical protein